MSYLIVLHQTKLLTPELSPGCTLRSMQLTTVLARLGSVQRIVPLPNTPMYIHQPTQIQVHYRLRWGTCKGQGVAVVNDIVTLDRLAAQLGTTAWHAGAGECQYRYITLPAVGCKT